ncbi:MAG TPA: hypothetical protein PKC98_01425, partial [Candidatus Melainabacteria bacterium]|nr:hypothetical protein [Candidatus Melainabacteria bacterium]
MAELHLTVTYKKKQMRPLLWLAYVIFPLWSLVAPFTIGLIVTMVLSRSLTLPPLFTFGLIFFLSFAFVLGLVYSAFAEDKGIHITKEGISFPLFLLPALKLKRHRNWDELASAELIETSQETYLRLGFKSDDSTVSLSLSSFDRKQLEEMLLAVELWGKQCERGERLIGYQKELQGENTTKDLPGYTQMWEEELARRFHATTFIPLEPGKVLQDGKLVVEKQLAFGGLSAIYLVQKEKKDLYILKEAVVPDDVDEDNRRIA